MFCLVNEENKLIYDHNYRLYSFTGQDMAEKYLDSLDIDKSRIKIMPFSSKLLLDIATWFLPKYIKEHVYEREETSEQKEVKKKLEENNVDINDYAPLGLLPNGQPRKRKFSKRGQGSVKSEATQEAPLGLLPNGQPRKKKFSHRKRKK